MDSGDPGAPGPAVVRPVEEETRLEKESVTLQLLSMEEVTVMEGPWRIEFAIQNLVSYKIYHTLLFVNWDAILTFSVTFLKLRVRALQNCSNGLVSQLERSDPDICRSMSGPIN